MTIPAPPKAIAVATERVDEGLLYAESAPAQTAPRPNMSGNNPFIKPSLSRIGEPYRIVRELYLIV